MSPSKIARLGLLASAALCMAVPNQSGAADMKPEDIVAKHLESIGTAQARAAAKNRVAQGTAKFKVLVGGAGELDGKSGFVSEGHKLRFLAKFTSGTYHGEQFVSDGEKVEVAFSSAQQTRSPFGAFVFVQNTLVLEGLFGSVLSTGWPLLDLEARKAKLDYQGLKKIDGHDLYDIRYRPKKSTDVEIDLYFEPETFHHVLTVYKLSIRAPIATSQSIAGEPVQSGEVETARQQDSRYRLEERFSDFKTVDGLTLPSRYEIQYSQQLQNGNTGLSQWVMVFDQMANNVQLDPKNFQVK